VTSSIAFEGNGRVNEYVGGYEVWQQHGGRWSDEIDSAVEKPVKTQDTAPTPTPIGVSTKKKLSYKLQRELDGLPAAIDKAEKAIAQFHDEIGSPSFYQQTAEQVAETLQKVADKEAALEELFERWTELEEQ